MAKTLNEQDPQQAELQQAEAQPAEPQQADSQRDQIEEFRREKEAAQDRLMRVAAEFDNYRKRVDRERRDLAEYTAADLIGELLPIVDNLERALSAASEADPLRKGVELILKQTLDLLRKRGVKPIEALGADFYPNFHQAVVHEPSEEHREGEVMEEMQRGYLLGERLLRPAMVKVAKSA